jgi:hypothetical protein
MRVMAGTAGMSARRFSAILDNAVDPSEDPRAPGTVRPRSLCSIAKSKPGERPADLVAITTCLAGARSQTRAAVVQGQLHIPSGVDIRQGLREAAHIREAVGSKPNSANTCGHTDRDGNPAGKDVTRTRSARGH